MRQCDWSVRVCCTDNYSVWHQQSIILLWQSLSCHFRQCTDIFHAQIALSHSCKLKSWIQYREISMKKNEAYHSTLSIHCQWKKGTEECSTYEQPHYYRALHRVSQFDDQYGDKNQLIIIQQRVQQCLQHFVTQISWLCRHISDSWKTVSVCERFTWPCHWLETETTALIQKAILHVLSWTQCTEGISRQCNESRHHMQVNITCSFTCYVCAEVEQQSMISHWL